MIESIYLYLTTTTVYARRRSGFPWCSTIETCGRWDWNAGNPESLDLDALDLSSRKHRRLHIYLGSALCKLLAVELPSQLRDFAEQQAAAKAQMQLRLGLNMSEWDVVLSPVAADRPTVSCAVKIALIRQLQHLASKYQLSLRTIRPYFVGVWNEFQADEAKTLAPKAALMVLEMDAYTTIVAHKKSIHSISTLFHKEEPDLVGRELRRLGIFGGGESSAWIALPTHLHSMVNVDAVCTRLTSTALTPRLCGDFRDLSFSAGEQS